MNRTYLLIGGNLGNRQKNLELARHAIEAHCGLIEKKSSLYETAAWGKTDQSPFLNQVLFVETKLSPRELLEQILRSELEMGRQRNERYGPRTIDIDILLYDDAVVHEEGLTIPHPRMHLRRFVLEPLNEIAKDLIHPVIQKTIHELLEECPDALAVKKI